MATISIPICAYILTLYPEATAAAGAGSPAPAGGASLRPLALGLATPSFWTEEEINRAFTEANRIWLREADIQFSPVNISRRDEVVPADARAMWIRFVNRLSPRGQGIGVGFVYDLPAAEGGWGGGRIVVLSGEKVREGIAGFAGNLLAHELGHVLIDDPNHALAGDDHSNLMHHSRNPRVANAGLLNATQVERARATAATF
ncbi:hypothetical protein HDIA_4313 [Hartmannibacter diazotrophicus]|uniref:Uncharacterized protein n=1 Tax=Hartmannibacter diazotrophicus TaxID=1482074 RepID=A0A2C9DC04_9HYPH|nr:hypothetical protein [Hartmannibacter diazotrophicus]SON57854.1 hypothetical protein HDIA_4313 [Hartmannibacter diazotrophicus]